MWSHSLGITDSILRPKIAVRTQPCSAFGLAIQLLKKQHLALGSGEGLWGWLHFAVVLSPVLEMVHGSVCLAKGAARDEVASKTCLGTRSLGQESVDDPSSWGPPHGRLCRAQCPFLPLHVPGVSGKRREGGIKTCSPAEFLTQGP